MARRSPPRKVTYFEPVPPRLARNTIIESTFEVGRRFRCTMRIDCGELDPGAVIRPEPGEWHPRMPERLDDEELADWRAGRNAVYQPSRRLPQRGEPDRERPVSADPTTRWRGREGRVWVDSGYRPCASASIATPKLGRAKTPPLRSSRGTGPASAES
jgi:hypothetical protein